MGRNIAESSLSQDFEVGVDGGTLALGRIVERGGLAVVGVAGLSLVVGGLFGLGVGYWLVIAKPSHHRILIYKEEYRQYSHKREQAYKPPREFALFLLLLLGLGGSGLGGSNLGGGYFGSGCGGAWCVRFHNLATACRCGCHGCCHPFGRLHRLHFHGVHPVIVDGKF